MNILQRLTNKNAASLRILGFHAGGKDGEDRRIWINSVNSFKLSYNKNKLQTQSIVICVMSMYGVESGRLTIICTN